MTPPLVPSQRVEPAAPPPQESWTAWGYLAGEEENSQEWGLKSRPPPETRFHGPQPPPPVGGGQGLQLRQPHEPSAPAIPSEGVSPSTPRGGAVTLLQRLEGGSGPKVKCARGTGCRVGAQGAGPRCASQRALRVKHVLTEVPHCQVDLFLINNSNWVFSFFCLFAFSRAPSHGILWFPG